RYWRPPVAVRVVTSALFVAVSACGDDGRGIVEVDDTSLQGVVVRAGTQVRLPDVPVTMDGRVVVSDSRGQYRFDDVPVGEATLSVSYPGYLPYERLLEILEGANSFDIPLLPD
ncbi:MAG: carboxypeptidase regulatory-like domain-containing protein, partial [Gemmatimonadetes bacterium]|nr:carboxypeptidase regulatory-like domain-containing protein [Gemmatimonadota bacterium]